MLVERYQDVMYGTAFLMTRNHASAGEATQEAFLRAWRALAGYRGGSLRAWLVRILVNQVISSARRKSLESVPLEDVAEARFLEQSGDDPAVETERLLEREAVQRALQGLSEEQRQVVTLRYFAELSVEETAVALGIRQGTVKSRLFRALERLRGILAAKGANGLEAGERGGLG